MLQDKLKKNVARITGPLASFVSLKIPFTCTADNFWKSLVVQDSVYYILGDDAIFHVLLRNFTSKVGEPLPGTYPYRNSSRSVWIPSRWLARKIVFQRPGPAKRFWSSYLKWLSSSIVVVAWPVQREGFRGDGFRKEEKRDSMKPR